MSHFTRRHDLSQAQGWIPNMSSWRPSNIPFRSAASRWWKGGGGGGRGGDEEEEESVSGKKIEIGTLGFSSVHHGFLGNSSW